MVRTKGTPSQAPGGSSAAPLLLRVRHAGGVCRVQVPADSTLAQLRSALEEEVGGGELQSLSFRSADGAVVRLLEGGEFPAGGALIIGGDASLATLGLQHGDMLQSSFQSGASEGKGAVKVSKRRAAQGGGGGAAAKGRKRARSGAGGKVADGTGLLDAVAADGGAGVRDSAEKIAIRYISTIPTDALLRTSGAALFSTQEGAARLEAVQRNLVSFEARGRRLRVDWRAGPRRRLSMDEVRLLSSEELVDVAVEVMKRQGGSKRRQSGAFAAQAPSLVRLLGQEQLASRLPAFFWSAAYLSKGGDAGAPPDVPFVLEQVLESARARCLEWVAGRDRGGGDGVEGVDGAEGGEAVEVGTAGEEATGEGASPSAPPPP